MSFVHLHCHSEYSLLDGLARIPQMVQRAKELGQPAIALTDHGVMYGAIEFWQAATDAGLKPIIGLEGYLARGKMSERLPGEDNKPYHLLLLAKNLTGYHNLLHLASVAQLQGFYYKPRVDKETLAQYSEGLICTTGCMAAEIPNLIADDRNPEKARKELGWYVDVFGAENFFLEVQEHGMPDLREVNKTLAEFQPHFNLRFIATNDLHYIRPEEAAPHDVLLCIQTSKLVSEANRMRMSDGSYYLKSREEMEAVLGMFPGAIDNTRLVADMCDVNLKTKGYHLPVCQVPEGYTPDTYLRHICEAGLLERYGDRATDPAVRARLDYELQVIHQMGFDAYFIIVWDLCRFARERDIWWNVRGSGASSIVAYTSGITNLDPLRNSLIFERFLNPSRISMPDIDLDYPDDRRGEMIEYTVQKYGKENVAQIITFGTLGARAAIRDVGRAMDIPLSEVDKIAKLVPSGPKVKLKDAFENNEFKELYDSTDYIHQLVDTAAQLEGVNRHASTHAAGVVIADKPLEEYLPLHRPTKDTAGLGVITQFPMEIIEKIGLLKVDFLGLATLTIMRRACELIEQRHGVHYDLINIPFTRRPDDPEQDAKVKKLFALLASGHVDGIFQVESEGMRKVLTSMKPTEFEHIIAVVALYRPGPMDYIPSFVRRMHGEEPVTYHHPDLEPILKETYGICVSGDAWLFDPLTGKRCRLDEADKIRDLHLQGVAADLSPAIGRVTHWICNGRKPVYRVTLRSGANIKVTADHRLLTENGWRPLAELRPGDYLAMPTKMLGPNNTYSHERLRVLAYLLSDGDLGNLAAVNFVSKDPALLAEYQRCLAAFANVRVTTTEQARGVLRLTAAKASVTHYHAPNALLQWLRELGLKNPAGSSVGGCRSHEKFIPDFVFSLGEDDLAFFLASLWDGDGYMGRKLCHYKTISPRLAEDVQMLLLRLGLRSTIYISHYQTAGRNGSGPQRRSAYQVTVFDTARLLELFRPYLFSAKRDVVCVGQDAPTIDRRSFIAEVDEATTLSRRALMAAYGIDRLHFYRTRRDKPRISARVAAPLAEALALPETRRRLNVDWEEIISIEPAGIENVYDLTVEGLHNFVANNIIVHNCVYQEQIIQIATNMAGYTAGDADQLRRAVGKKKAEEIAKHKAQFIAGATKLGYTPAVAEAVYGDIEFFANYGFNKAHACDYAMITCQTAFLKAHYPVEYMTALLSVSKNDTAKVALYSADSRRMGLAVLPPDINTSGVDFTIEDSSGAKSTGHPLTNHQPPNHHAIRFGMGAVKNVGEGAVQVILDARQASGPFSSLDDFCQRVDLRQVGKRPLECLIKVGALDRFGDRGQLLEGLDAIVNASASHFRAAELGQLTLFGGSSGFAGVALPKSKITVPQRERLGWEKELIGLYVSDHPLQPVIDDLEAVVTHYSRQLTEDDHGKPVTMAGIVTIIRPYQTKKGDAMGFVSVEDLQGPLELVVFPKVWREVSKWLKLEQIVVIQGKVDFKDGSTAKILVDSLSREFKVTRSAEPARPPTPAWSADEPPPWLDNELPPPEETGPRSQGLGTREASVTASPQALAPSPRYSNGNNASAQTSRCLIITIHSTGDGERDVRRMRRVHGLLTSYPGQDRFEFRITDAQRNYQLRFPNDSTGYCETLAKQLTELLGSDTIEVQTQ